MLQLIARMPAPLLARLRARFGSRAAGIALTLLVELLLALLLLTLGRPVTQPKPVEMTVFGIDTRPDAAPEAEEEPAPSEDTVAEPPAEATAPPPPEATTPATPATVTPPQPAPPLPPIIQLSPAQMAAADIAPTPAPPAAAPARRAIAGPPDTGRRSNGMGDTPRVAGSGPNGEPLYAASWYREPYDSELRGYLSTARGPGWGLIACRTVPDYRVEDCVKVDESPEGSNIARAALAAAWQFRVRPPRIGGELKVGEWVQIRIDYEQRR